MIKIVTDSSSDLSAEISSELEITVVPLYVRFGEEIYRERVTITDEQFYNKLVNGAVHPVTIQPNPADFIPVYEKLAREADGIISIHISSKLSGTFNSAVQAKNMVNAGCPIEVIDSQTVSIALGVVVIAAAEAAMKGKSMQEILQITREAVDYNQALCLLDTLKYLQMGGRIGKAQALLGTMLNIKPIISVKGGEVVPFGRVRSRAKGIEQLVNFVKNTAAVEDILVGYTTTADEAGELCKRIESVFTKRPVRPMRLGTTLGVHVGPGALVVSLRCGATRDS